jgi:electron transfer flavoprotein alpha subunit
MSVLVIAEHLQGRIRDVTYELVTAARELGGPVTVAVIGDDPAALDVNREGVDEVVT